jgi:DNA topoisomerase-1
LQKYTLLITEKPDAANRIATALDEQGKPKKAFANGVPYYEAYRGGNIVVVPALGHLYTVTSKERTRDYPVFDYQWVPKYLAEKGAQESERGFEPYLTWPKTPRHSSTAATTTSRAA